MHIINRVDRIIVKKLIREALRRGYLVAIDNGGVPYEVPFTSDYKALCEGAFATDEETFYFRKDGKTVGGVFCVYGEYGWDVICDHTDNAAINELVATTERITKKFEELLG